MHPCRVLSLIVLSAACLSGAARAARVRPAAERGSFIVLLSDQADVRAAYRMKDASARGWYVYRTLKDHADRTQAGIQALLQQAGAPYRALWAANAIVVEGDAALRRALLSRPEVRAIEDNLESRGIEPPGIARLALDTGVLAGGVEWGVQSINADQVWDLGATGAGIVIGNADTGMQWDHPAIVAQYRGWDGAAASHDHNWHDAIHNARGNPCGNDASAPCDDSGHGTHTTGTVVGDDGAGNQIGVAPGAQWIGCRNMDRGNGTPARYIECFQFFIAPTDLADNNPDPDQRPHVINNSWGCPRSEGCAADTLQLVVENTQAAGIFVEVSAGNSGPACATVDDVPAIYEASFSTGAYDSISRIASFSSRGAVALDGSGRMKPDLSAPGVGVRSCLPGDRFGKLSGTSMAGPHVVGAVALLWSARPELLRLIDETKAVLLASANPAVVLPAPQTCAGLTSDFIPNNSFGAGRVDVLSAVSY